MCGGSCRCCCSCLVSCCVARVSVGGGRLKCPPWMHTCARPLHVQRKDRHTSPYVYVWLATSSLEHTHCTHAVHLTAHQQASPCHGERSTTSPLSSDG